VQPPRYNHQVGKRVKQLVLAYRRILTAHRERTPRYAPAVFTLKLLSLAIATLGRSAWLRIKAKGHDEHC
jgi:hypothetical protein